MSKKKRVLVAAAALFIAGAIALSTFFNRIVLWAMTPTGRFDAAAVPRPPDYADPVAWSALPGLVHTAAAALPALPAVEQTAAPADVFYVHPTSYIGGNWNGPIDDARLNADTDRVATRIQATVFNACCAVYAPRYRQANGTAFSHPSPDGQRARDVAYGDVAAAFQHFLTHYNRARPFILAGHSQGSSLARRLLAEQIAARPDVQKRLVAAYLIGTSLTVEGAAREFPSVPTCQSPEQTGCVIAWNARGPHNQPGDFEFRELAADPHSPPLRARNLLCVNPLTWRSDEAAAAASLNEGAVFLEDRAPSLRPAFASAQCQAGTLVVAEIGHPPRDFMSKLLDRALGAENYHPIEYQLFYVNLRRNAQARVAAFGKPPTP